MQDLKCSLVYYRVYIVHVQYLPIISTLQRFNQMTNELILQQIGSHTIDIICYSIICLLVCLFVCLFYSPVCKEV